MKIAGMTYSIALIILLSGFTLCHAGSITYSTDIEVNGVLKLKDSPLCFSDGSCQDTAVFSDGSAIWGQITGYIDDQLDLSVKFATKEDKASKGVAGGYAPLDESGKIPTSFLSAGSGSILLSSTENYNPLLDVTWKLNSNVWNLLQSYVFTNTLPSAVAKITYSDNVGFYANNVNGTYCNLGVFLDDAVTPVCSASFSGVYGFATFDHKTLTCIIPLVTTGDHTFYIKHRSDNCSYGSSPKGEFSTSRAFYLEFMAVP